MGSQLREQPLRLPQCRLLRSDPDGPSSALPRRESLSRLREQPLRLPRTSRSGSGTSGYCRPWSGPPGCGGANFLMEADDVYCDPTQTDPPQLCPGEKACPDCGSNRCACPALLAPAPAPAGSECSNNWEVNNNGGENIPPGDKPVQGVTDPDGCKQACSDHVKCVGWTWTSGKCYIKSSVGCMTYDPAAPSGYCRPWSGPPGCGGQ